MRRFWQLSLFLIESIFAGGSMKDHKHLIKHWKDQASQHNHIHLEIPCVCGVCRKWGSGQLRCCNCGDVRPLRAAGKRAGEIEGVMDAFIEKHKDCQKTDDDNV
jgi:hypothetical protein